MKTSPGRYSFSHHIYFPIEGSRARVKSQVLLRSSSCSPKTLNTQCGHLTCFLRRLQDYSNLIHVQFVHLRFGLCWWSLNSPPAPPPPPFQKRTLINSALSFEFYRALSKHKLYIVKGGVKGRPHPYFLSGCNQQLVPGCVTRMQVMIPRRLWQSYSKHCLPVGRCVILRYKGLRFFFFSEKFPMKFILFYFL